MSQSGIISLLSTPLPPSVPLVFATDSGNAIAASNTITFHGVGGTFSGSGSTVTFTSSGGGTTWTSTSGSFTAAASHGYFLSGASTPTLPASPTEGDTISFICDTGSTVTITANTGQKIRLGSTISASAGTCASSTQGNSISLVYRSTGTTWIAIESIGTWTIT